MMSATDDLSTSKSHITVLQVNAENCLCSGGGDGGSGGAGSR